MPEPDPERGRTHAARAQRETTRRRTAEHSLRQAEEHIDEVIANVRDYAVFLLDPEGHVQTWNAGAEAIKGYRADEIIGRHFSTFYTAEDRARQWPEQELEAATLQGRFEDEGWRLRKDGTRFWANVVITAFLSEEGTVRGFLKITRDLTERKRAEDALRSSEQRLRLMVESVQDYAILMLDPEGCVASWNPGARQIKGYEAEEIIGQHFRVFYPEDVRPTGWPEKELELARQRDRFEDEGWRVRKDGTRFWANVVISSLRDHDGTLRGYVKVTRDLTERKAAEEALRRAHDELERRVETRTRELRQANEQMVAEMGRRRQLEDQQRRLEEQLRQRLADLATADRHKNEFLAMLGHELRNPLAPIRNALEILKIGPSDEATRSRAEGMMERQVEHLVRLVDDLLDLSRVMQGKIELRREPIEISAVLERALETAQPTIEARGHRVTLTPPREPVIVAADPVRLTQVIGNLLINAAKYTEDPGEITLEAGVEEDAHVTIRVRDTGIGIPAELLPRIFDFFVQGARSGEGAQGGLGIGLTLVQRIVELHGGEVTAESHGPGLGSVFTIRLPTLAGSAQERPANLPPVASRDPPSRPLRVLVVDDNLDATESTAALLAVWGHEARVANTGEAALAAARTFLPDAILLDLGLPDMSGLEVAERLRDEGPAARLLVAVTGYGQDVDRHRTATAGFHQHFVKPLDPQRLRLALEALSTPLGKR